MINRSSIRVVLAFALLAVLAPCAHADDAKIGFSINVEGEGFFLNPIVSKIHVTEVQKGSLAAAAGIVAGDDILQIEGETVAGKRGRDLQRYLAFGPGETRTLHLKHTNGEQFDARLTKPK